MPGGATTIGPDATPPQLSVKTWGGGGSWGGVQPGVGGGSSRGSGVFLPGVGGGLAGGQGGVQLGVKGGGG